MKKLSLKFLSLALFLTLLFSLGTGVVFAQLPQRPELGNPSNQTGITNPAIGDLGDDSTMAASGATFQRYFLILWNALIGAGGLSVIVYFLWGAIEWISAGGDSGKVQKARDKITQAVIGMVLLVGSYAMIGFISQLFFGESFNILQLSL